MSYQRTPFGKRLLDSRKAAQLTQDQAAKAVGIRQGTLAELEKQAHSSGYTVQLATLYNVSSEWLATGFMAVREETPGWPVSQRPVDSKRLRGNPAHLSTSKVRFDQVPVIAWENLMPLSAPNRFAVKCPDDSMSPFLRSGSVVYLERALTPSPGDIVLVEDSQSRFYLRLYRPRSASAWEAKPLNDLYQSLDSEREGLTLMAVFVGMEGRVGQS